MLVPKLRFKEFTDEWQTKKLDSLFNVITDFVAAGSFADLRNNVEYNSCIDYAQLIRTIDIKNKFNNKDFVYINEKAYNFLWRVNLDKDAIILPNIGANIGERYYIDYKKLPYNKSALGPNAILLRSTNYNLKYLFNLFNTKSFEVQLKNIVGASGQPKFNKTDLKKFSFNISNNENEQNKIAKFISLIDKKIELQSKKIEVLKLYKKGLNNNIFANIINKISLREIVDYANGNGYENYVDEKGNYKLISLNSINIDGKLINNMKRVNIEKPKTLNKGDIVMVLSDVGHGDFLGVSAVIPNNNEYVLNQRMGLLRINNGTSPEYLVSVINYNQKKFKLLGQGSSQLNLSKDDILDIYIEYPNIQLQSIIAKENININKKIDLEFAKLELLNQLKKSLMQNMFV